jgi:class I fructose-bisphosphate aldolase/fructose-bisphosphate aldolase/2-amino-3,7-dideoxy-D-threo-hept-6-ulosonate synthase
MSTTRRINRILRPDGRALIVAMDHGLLDGPCKGLERPEETIAKIVAGGADAVLTSVGVAQRFAKQLAPVGLIVRIDGSGTSLGPSGGPSELLFSVEGALRLGADAVAVNAFPGAAEENASLKNLAATIEAAHPWGLAVLGEMVPGGFDSDASWRTLENIALSTRIGAEMGADFIKTPYAPGFESVIDTTYVPVVILGGAKRGNERAMLADIKAAVDAGGAGVAIGRNIFQSADPQAMTAAVAAILHESATVDEAMAILERGSA